MISYFFGFLSTTGIVALNEPNDKIIPLNGRDDQSFLTMKRGIFEERMLFAYNIMSVHSTIVYFVLLLKVQ